jgi:N-acetylmuramoyl-L-alanine amidase
MMHLLIEHFSDLKINRTLKHRLAEAKMHIRGRYAASAILLSLFIFIMCPVADAVPPILEADTPVVVIDPGHGGNDTGATGPGGTQEKTVTLDLARLIADQLTNSCQVVLTRSDDYRLEIPERTAVANRSAADIFISLHTGSSFISSIAGSAVYFYQQFTESALTAEVHSPKPLTDSGQPVNWDQIQLKYRISSEKLAALIQHEINGFRRPPDTKIQGAPLLVLEGADMPAVAIEIGNLSNPEEEKMLRDPEFLTRFARAIARAVDRFFTQKPP